MMDIGQIISLAIAIIWGVGFIRLPLITWQAINYVKKKYQRDWEDELQGKIGTSIFGGKTVFQFLAKFDDQVIMRYRNRWNAALRQLLFSVLFSFFIIVVYIYAMSK
jgi:hypothetical protein